MSDQALHKDLQADVLRNDPRAAPRAPPGATFDKKAKTYDQPSKFARVAWMAGVIRQRPWFQSSAGAMGDGLDFGCGTGMLSFEMLPHCRHVTGMDLSTGMLDIMRAKAGDAGVEEKVTMTTAGLEQLPQQYDFIFTALALHHVKDCGAKVTELMLRTKPSGRLLIVDFEESPRSHLFHKATEKRGVEYEHDGLLAESLVQWLADAGGQDIDVVKEPFEKELHQCWNPKQPGEKVEFNMIFASAVPPTP